MRIIIRENENMPENHSNKFPNGYTRIPHEILNAIATSNFISQEYRIINFIIRMTYGCSGTEYLHLDSWSELSAIGIYRYDYKRLVEQLESYKVIIVDWETRMIKINTNVNEWITKKNALANTNSKLYNKILSRQLVGKQQTLVGKQQTNGQDLLVNDKQECLLSTNNDVGKQQTTTEPTSNDSLPDSTPINSIKDSIKEKKEKEASSLSFGNNLPIVPDAIKPNDYIIGRNAILIKYPQLEKKLSDGDVGYMLSQMQHLGLEYWQWVLKEMPEWDKLTIQNIHGIVGYGKNRAVSERYKKENKIQVFFGR